jgi:hypothetical protein
MDSRQRLKMAMIAGANHALKYKRQKKMSSDEEALKHVSDESDNILNTLGSDE